MIIQYASDLHVEFEVNKAFLRKNPLKPIGEVLILAGDILPYVAIPNQDDFFKYLSHNFKTTYWIPGNHEYYQSDIEKEPKSFCKEIYENVFLVNNMSFIHDDIKIICSTLWTNIPLTNQYQIESRMNDFHLIRIGKKRLTADYVTNIHKEQLEFIKSELENNSGLKTIVATHHLPTFKNYPEKYRNSNINGAFVTELFDFIEKYQPDYWIYGHHHANTPEFNISITKLVTNQLGYVQMGEHEGFKADKVIDV